MLDLSIKDIEASSPGPLRGEGRKGLGTYCAWPTNYSKYTSYPMPSLFFLLNHKLKRVD